MGWRDFQSPKQLAPKAKCTLRERRAVADVELRQQVATMRVRLCLTDVRVEAPINTLTVMPPGWSPEL
jgi:hypothetical protein